MATLVLDTFPTLTSPIRANAYSASDVWVMDRDQAINILPPPEVRTIYFAHVLCDPIQTTRIIESLRAKGYNRAFVIAVPEGIHPPPGDLLSIIAPSEIKPISILDYGPHTQQILAKGLTITDDDALFIERPERVSITERTSSAAIEEKLEHYLSLWKSPNRATFHTEGSTLFLSPLRTQSWLTKLLSSAICWQTATYRGGGVPSRS